MNSGCHNDDMLTNYGRAIKALREKLGISQKSLAKEVNYTAAYLSLIECGRRRLPDTLIERIFVLYEIAQTDKDMLINAIAADRGLEKSRAGGKNKIEMLCKRIRGQCLSDVEIEGLNHYLDELKKTKSED